MNRKVLEMSWYSDFICVGGECPLTCCTTWWKIELLDEEIERYEKMEHPYADEIIQAIDKEGNRFKGNSCRKCKLLTEDGWCSIVRKCGEEYLSLTCALYPRQIKDYGDIVERTLDITCPESASFLFKKEPVFFNYNEVEMKEEFAPIDYESYDMYAMIRNYLIELWQSEEWNITYADKYYIMLHLYYKIKNLSERGRFHSRSAKQMLKIFSKSDTIHALADVSKAIHNDREACLKLLHYFFVRTGDVVVENILINRERNYDIELLNKWLRDRDLFIQNVNDYLEHFRQTYPRMAENYFVYALFLFWMEKSPEDSEKIILSSKLPIKCVEWLWIQLIAASFWTRQKKIDEFEVYIAEIDRCIDHGSVIRRELAKIMKEISFDQEARMLILALF